MYRLFQTVSNPSHFKPLVKLHLDQISQGEVGSRLLRKIGNGKHSIIIKYDPLKDETNYENPMDAYKKGAGSNSTIKISHVSITLLGMKGEPIFSPHFIILAHELIHAYHAAYGKLKAPSESFTNTDVWTNPEELNAILKPDIGCRTKPKISENAIHDEHGLPLRFSHISGKASEETKIYIKQKAQQHQIGSIFQQCAFKESFS
jgi:hypothetical protein